MKIIDIAGMRAFEREAVAAGIPEAQLMRTAGRHMAEAIRRRLAECFFGGAVRRIVVVVGRGNNGGDGIVAGEALRDCLPVELFLLDRPENFRSPAREMALECARPVVRPEPEGDEFRPGDLIVDAIAGIGVKTSLSGAPRAWVDAINRSGCPVVALDLPSGLSGDSGEGAPAVVAALTLAAGAFKPGHFRNPAVGCLEVVSIGAPESLLDALPTRGEAFTAADAAAFLVPPPVDVHKNGAGRVLVIGGCAAYGGAPLLTTRGALRGGAGMVRAVVPDAALRARNWPGAAILRPVPGAFLSLSAREAIRECAAQSDVVVCGPGIGLASETEALLEWICTLPQPLLLDADALTLLARHPEWAARRTAPLLLTPHPGEAARLCPPESGEERRDWARRLADAWRATVVLKGYQSVVADADGESFNPSGAPTLATAGSGDVLAGLIGAFWSRRSAEPGAAARAAVWVHGRAGELTTFGRGMVADDLPELAARAAREIAWGF